MQRRADVVAAHSLDHVEFEVPSLDDATRFYSAFGLEVTRAGNALHVCTHGDPRPWLILHAGGPVKKLRHVTFGIYEQDMPVFRERAAAHGVASLAGDRSVWFRDPHGVAVELAVGPKRSPDRAHQFEVSPRGDRGAPLRSATKPVTPRRLSHALLFTPDLEASIAFYRDMVGLRLSDEAGVVAFMHAPHGSDHHVLAFARSGGSGLHHVSWAVDSLEDVGIGAMQMAEAGFARGWGIGRHVLGSNYFQYVRDPWGSYSEYSFDIDHVPFDRDWPATSHSPENGFYLWGPPPPEDFTTNYEI
ncbi:MAG: VOC family protein [Kofleriaceae bacterium]